MAAECSPGRKPGVSGTEELKSPRSGRQRLALEMKQTLTIILLGLTLVICSYAQDAVQPGSDDEILRALMPNGNWAEERNLKQFKWTDEIRALKHAQITAKDWRAISIAYLLALLKYDYAANRNRMLRKYHSCKAEVYPHKTDCWDAISDLMMGLFRNGDDTMLRPVMKLGPSSDGDFAEGLGSFYADTLWKRPRLFLSALAGLPPKTQLTDAMLAATVDGGGMEPGMLRDVKLKLRRIARNRQDRLRPIARLCLREVMKWNSQTKSP